MANHVTYANFPANILKFLAKFSANVESKSFKEAAKYETWKKAMQQQIDALEKNNK